MNSVMRRDVPSVMSVTQGRTIRRGGGMGSGPYPLSLRLKRRCMYSIPLGKEDVLKRTRERRQLLM